MVPHGSVHAALGRGLHREQAPLRTGAKSTDGHPLLISMVYCSCLASPHPPKLRQPPALRLRGTLHRPLPRRDINYLGMGRAHGQWNNMSTRSHSRCDRSQAGTSSTTGCERAGGSRSRTSANARTRPTPRQKGPQQRLPRHCPAAQQRNAGSPQTESTSPLGSPPTAMDTAPKDR